MTVCEWFRPSRFWSYFLVKTLFVFGIELIILFSFVVIVLSGSRSLNRRKAKIQKETKRGRECTTLLTFATFYCTFFVYCHRFSIKCSRIRSLNRRIAKLICRHSADHRHRSSLPIYFLLFYLISCCRFLFILDEKFNLSRQRYYFHSSIVAEQILFCCCCCCCCKNQKFYSKICFLKPGVGDWWCKTLSHKFYDTHPTLVAFIWG